MMTVMTIEQVKTRLRRQREIKGRLLTSPDGSEWIRACVTKAQLNYYPGLVKCYGFIPDLG